MVRKEGQENGSRIDEVQGYEKIEPRVRKRLENFIQSQDFVDSDKVDVSEIIVFGSYGCGYGVPGKSDLDLILSFSAAMDYRSNDLSQFLKHAAGQINKDPKEILSGVEGIDDLEAFSFPALEVNTELQKMASHEPIDSCYSLTDDSKRSFY